MSGGKRIIAGNFDPEVVLKLIDKYKVSSILLKIWNFFVINTSISDKSYISCTNISYAIH